MSHKRTQIIAALAARLTGLATTSSRVFVDRIKPLTDAELPAILIHEGGEDTPESYLGNSVSIGRPMRVVVSILVKATAGAADTSNTVLGEIEAALFDTTAHNTLGGLVHFVRLASIDDPDMDDSLEKPVRRLSVIFRVNYS